MICYKVNKGWNTKQYYYILLSQLVMPHGRIQLLQLAGGVEGVDNGEGQQQLAHQFVELGAGQGKESRVRRINHITCLIQVCCGRGGCWGCPGTGTCSR